MDDLTARVIRATLEPEERAGLELSQEDLRRILGAPELGAPQARPPVSAPASAVHAVQVGVRTTAAGGLVHEVSLLGPPPAAQAPVASWAHDTTSEAVREAVAAVRSATAPEERATALLGLAEALTGS